MIEIFEYPDQKEWPRLMKRPASDNTAIENTVREIVDSVKRGGDKAVAAYTKKFDSQSSYGNETISTELKEAIAIAKKNIETFHLHQLSEQVKIQTMNGVACWQESRAIEKVGLYIPGGSAPLFSTILMLAIPARIAGCKEIILCCPSDHPAIIYTAQLCGINKIFKTGGAQAIAAMAYGTENIPKVNKLFGPGNGYVTTAKQLVQLEGTAIDIPAGPSELLIIADESADANYVAADLLSQAEHAADAQVILVTTSKVLAHDVLQCIRKQIADCLRKDTIIHALANASIILFNSISEAIAFSNEYAPEHLIIATKENITKQISSAGSVFIGNYSPVSAGDYASGTNHTLPTNGFAASYSGVTVESFQKKIFFQKISKQGLKNISSAVITMAEAEGLDAHANAIKIRL